MQTPVNLGNAATNCGLLPASPSNKPSNCATDADWPGCRKSGTVQLRSITAATAGVSGGVIPVGLRLGAAISLQQLLWLPLRSHDQKNGSCKQNNHNSNCECHPITFPNATAVSFMRFEKPHSLSYQARMRTKVPSSTLVWSIWNVDECGSWLKSIETLGCSV